MTKIKITSSYETTDGKVFTSKIIANQHQKYLDAIEYLNKLDLLSKEWGLMNILEKNKEYKTELFIKQLQNYEKGPQEEIQPKSPSNRKKGGSSKA